MSETQVEEVQKAPPNAKKGKASSKTKPTPQKNGHKPQIEPVPKIITFFARINSISKADWGSRACLKLYRLEPIIDRLRGSENKMVVKYEEPVDENRIMLDYGSGRYRLYLNFKMPGEHEGKELDSVEFDILNMQYPPKIPAGE